MANQGRQGRFLGNYQNNKGFGWKQDANLSNRQPPY